MTLHTVHGVKLNLELRGSGEPLLLLHGFTGSGATWDGQLSAFSRRYTTMAGDLLGHGGSEAPADPARYAIEQAVGDWAALLRGVEGSPAHVLGYSLGGRIALRLALDFPAQVRSLILESASAGIMDADERRTRAERDQATARLIERDGAAAFVAFWEAQPLFASHRSMPAQARARLRAERLATGAVGLTGTLRGAGQGAQEALNDRLPELRIPVLFVVGELDGAARNRAETMAAACGTARVETIEGAGHTPHLEQPRVFEQAVLSFLHTVTQSAPAPTAAALETRLA